jgi:hypothetical protein
MLNLEKNFNFAFQNISNHKLIKIITLVFRNEKNEKIEMKIELFHNNRKLYDKWINSLIEIINNKNIIYSKNFSLVGGFSKNRNKQLIIKQLIKAVEIIKKSLWYHEYDKINENYELLLNNFDRDLLNQLHHHFELLQGQVWNKSRFLEISNGEERYAISLLNLCCHELEALYDSEIREKNNEDHGVYFYFSVFGVPNFKTLTLEDKMSFSRKVKNGMVYLHYAQTGKSSAVNELGMREMQQRAFNSRHSQYLLLKAKCKDLGPPKHSIKRLFTKY